MHEHPIIFSAPMVRAILEGRKTQTRRVLKIRGVDGGQCAITSPAEEMLRFDDGTFHYRSTGALSGPYSCPYGQPGDRLWVRETWAETDRHDGTPVVTYAAGGCIAVGRGPQRRADDFLIHDYAWTETPEPDRWRPSIHMPRWASRITLEITDVRVERLQDMEGQAPYPGESDALAEGVRRIHHGDGAHFYSALRDEPHPNNWNDPTDAFRELWDSINESRGFGWNANPWVWCLSFRRMTP